jgi:hypothetical protein
VLTFEHGTTVAAAQGEGQLDVALVDGLEAQRYGSEPHLVAEGQRRRGDTPFVHVDAVLAFQVAHLDRVFGRPQHRVLARDLGHGEDDVVLGRAADAHLTRREHERAEGIADRPLEPQPRAGIRHVTPSDLAGAWPRPCPEEYGWILIPYSFQNE